MRLFVGLDIPNPIRDAITKFVDDARRIASDAKWVRPESYHVTLKFIGEWKRDVREVITVLDAIHAPAFDVTFRGCGFFPSDRAPRVFWTGIHVWEQVPSHVPGSEAPLNALDLLAHKVDDATASLGIPQDDHPYNPHLTLARTGSGSPRPKKDESMTPGMKRLAERIGAMPSPDFGTMHATEFFLYESKLSHGGAHYTKLKSFPLR